VSWSLRVAESLSITELPTDEELRLLREELDPKGRYLE
jgi:glutaconate CoA-transferase subunit B